MRTTLFSRFPLIGENEEFRKDVSALAAIPEALHEQLFGARNELLGARNTDDESILYRVLSQRLQIEESMLRRGITALNTLALRLREPQHSSDSPEDLAADLLDASVIQREQHESTLRLLGRLHASLQQLAAELARNTEAFASLPTLQNLSIRINYRPVFTDQYHLYTDLSSYSPICIGVVPVVTATLIVDGPEGVAKKELSFQMARHNVDAMINHLQSIQKMFEAADRFLRLDKSES